MFTCMSHVHKFIAGTNLSKLFHYLDEHPDASSTSKTLQYLEACNKFFEQAFLSHEKIFNMNSPVLISLKGFKFFTNWMDNIIQGMYTL